MFLRILRLLRAVGRNAIVLWYACRHRETPVSLKVGAILLVLYAISPIDLIPDWFPILGWIDDVTILAIGIPWILRRVPPHVLEEATAAAGGWFVRLRTGKR
jgi:uncharacterized membrane protein YkvA (DUF1232 family)